MSKYTEIRSKEPECWECFFAFSQSQFDEGVKNANIEGRKLLRGFGGLIGTKEGINKFMGFYDAQSEEIARECNAQDVYDYEFDNHECGCTCDDEECIKIVLDYFGIEKTKEVKRKFGYFKI